MRLSAYELTELYKWGHAKLNRQAYFTPKI
jgi:hypothetical protein